MTKQIFNYIQGVNPSVNTVSSIGNYVSELSQQVADRVLAEVINALPTDSLAHKIATSNMSRFTEKQLWVIAYELEKNIEFSAKVADFYANIDRKEAAKQQASKNKLAANKEASSDVLAAVKAAGKKLGDYYAFVKGNKQFAREFFSKKFTQNSVSAFLAQ